MLDRSTQIWIQLNTTFVCSHGLIELRQFHHVICQRRTFASIWVVWVVIFLSHNVTTSVLTVQLYNMYVLQCFFLYMLILCRLVTLLLLNHHLLLFSLLPPSPGKYKMHMKEVSSVICSCSPRSNIFKNNLFYIVWFYMAKRL